MSETIRTEIRQQIKSFPQEATYSTGWAGELTFAELEAQIAPQIANKIKRFGVYGQDIPDSVQTDLMRLWLRLIDERDLLAYDNLNRAVWRAFGGMRMHDSYCYKSCWRT